MSVKGRQENGRGKESGKGMIREKAMEYGTGKGKDLNSGQRRTGQVYGFFFYVPLFFLLSFAGWVWEAGIYLVKDGDFVNRGVLWGPWLPIYGGGGILLAFLLKRWEKKQVRVFFVSMAVCSVLEYLASFLLERTWGIRWWDYSGEFLNVGGRICLLASLLFGVGGWLLICYVIPYLRMLYRKTWRREKGRKGLQLLCLVLLLLFAADAAWAADFPHMGKGISF